MTTRIPDIGAARQQAIVRFVEQNGSARVASLAQALNVSEMTIRRDLDALASAGHLLRTHGGASTVSTATPSLNLRMGHMAHAKEAIARKAIGLIGLEDRIFMGGGSTVLALARQMISAPRCRVLTSTIPVATAAIGDGRHKVEITGGMYNPDFQNLRGDRVLLTVRERYFDISFISPHAIDAETGVLDVGDQQALLQPILASQSKRHVILADHSKIGRSASFRTLPWSSVSTLVIDKLDDDALRRALRDADVEIIEAGAG